MKESSWKTTVAGIAAIAGGISALCKAISEGSWDTTVMITAASAISTGVGLLFARDHKVSDEQAGAGVKP